MKKYLSIAVVSALFIGCGGTPTGMMIKTQTVKSALNNFENLKKDPNVEENAAEELYRAQKISNILREEDDTRLANHYAYLLNNQTKIASLTSEKAIIESTMNDVIVRRNEAIEAIYEQREAEGDVTATLAQLQAPIIKKAYTIDGENFDNETVRFTDALKTKIKNISLAAKNGKTIYLKSYTDNAGSQSYNIDMAQRRAQMIKDALIEEGINDVNIEIKAEGGKNFIASNDSEQGRKDNNRIMIEIK